MRRELCDERELVARAEVVALRERSGIDRFVEGQRRVPQRRHQGAVPAEQT